MTASMVRDESRFTRTFVWTVRDVPRQAHPEHHEIQPDRASLTLDREGENEPWEITWATIMGARVIKGGKLGASDEAQYYTWSDGVSDPLAPDWFVTLVNDAYELAERDRTQPAAQLTA